MSSDIERLVVLGPAGSYLDGLASSMDLGYPVEYGQDFDHMIAMAEASPATAILLPIKNTLKGTLNEVVGAFQGGKLMVAAAAQLDVVSNIMGVGTLDEVQKIGGKDVALEQITEWMPELERVVMPSTSAAGEYIGRTRDRTMLAVGSIAQAGIYGLDVLAKGVQDEHGLNRTTVLMVRGRNGWTFDPDSIQAADDMSATVIMRTDDSDQAGSLYRALGELDIRGINITNLESLNIRGTERSEFFATLEGRGTAIADLARASMRGAARLTLDVLGVYDQPAIHSS